MNRNNIDWAGAFPALTTPFTKDNRIDEKAFAANVDRLIAAGANGFVVAGCTGEFWSLSLDERKRYYDLAVEAVAKRVTLIVGTGAVTVDETVKLTNMAHKAGVDGVLILPPYFVKPDSTSRLERASSSNGFEGGLLARTSSTGSMTPRPR